VQYQKLTIMRRRKKSKNYEQGFYYPGTDIPIKVNKAIRKRWKICHYIRWASWIIIPCSFVLAPWLLIPWCFIHFLTLLGSADEKLVKAQEKGYIWPPEYGGF
jgi:hypothetical protein